MKHKRPTTNLQAVQRATTVMIDVSDGYNIFVIRITKKCALDLLKESPESWIATVFEWNEDTRTVGLMGRYFTSDTAPWLVFAEES